MLNQKLKSAYSHFIAADIGNITRYIRQKPNLSTFGGEKLDFLRLSFAKLSLPGNVAVIITGQNHYTVHSTNSLSTIVTQ